MVTDDSANVHIASDEVSGPEAHDGSNISLEFEEVGGNVSLQYQEIQGEEEEEIDERPRRQYVPRGKNKVYVLIEEFNSKEEFECFGMKGTSQRIKHRGCLRRCIQMQKLQQVWLI